MKKLCPICDMGCEHFVTINETVDYSGIAIAIHPSGVLRVRSYHENTMYADIININYCPICGKRLREKD